MLIPTLIVANIPVYLFLGWVVFDTKESAAETFFETIVAILKRILIPSIFRVFMDDDDDEAWGLLPCLAFLAACGGIVYGEYYWITNHYLPGG